MSFLKQFREEKAKAAAAGNATSTEKADADSVSKIVVAHELSNFAQQEAANDGKQQRILMTLKQQHSDEEDDDTDAIWENAALSSLERNAAIASGRGGGARGTKAVDYGKLENGQGQFVFEDGSVTETRQGTVRVKVDIAAEERRRQMAKEADAPQSVSEFATSTTRRRIGKKKSDSDNNKAASDLMQRVQLVQKMRSEKLGVKRPREEEETVKEDDDVGPSAASGGVSLSSIAAEVIPTPTVAATPTPPPQQVSPAPTAGTQSTAPPVDLGSWQNAETSKPSALPVEALPAAPQAIDASKKKKKKTDFLAIAKSMDAEQVKTQGSDGLSYRDGTGKQLSSSAAFKDFSRGYQQRKFDEE